MLECSVIGCRVDKDSQRIEKSWFEWQVKGFLTAVFLWIISQGCHLASVLLFCQVNEPMFPSISQNSTKNTHLKIAFDLQTGVRMYVYHMPPSLQAVNFRKLSLWEGEVGSCRKAAVACGLWVDCVCRHSCVKAFGGWVQWLGLCLEVGWLDSGLWASRAAGIPWGCAGVQLLGLFWEAVDPVNSSNSFNAALCVLSGLLLCTFNVNLLLFLGQLILTLLLIRTINKLWFLKGWRGICSSARAMNLTKNASQSKLDFG